MGLHDTDKNGDSRNNPSLNTVDGLVSSMAHATSGIAYRTESNSSTAPRVITKDDQMIVFDGTTNKALLGRDGNGSYVVKVAKDSFDVLTADDDELIFNSAQNVFKIVETGTTTVPATMVSAGTQTGVSSVTVNHNLGYRPVCVAFVEDSSHSKMLPYFIQNAGYITLVDEGFPIMNLNEYVYAKVTETSVIFTNSFVNGNYPGGTFTSHSLAVRYYLLRESAN